MHIRVLFGWLTRKVVSSVDRVRSQSSSLAGITGIYKHSLFQLVRFSSQDLSDPTHIGIIHQQMPPQREQSLYGT